jgi:hypothetical protein
MPHYLNRQIYHETLQACFLTSLCDFLEKTTRKESLTYRQFVESQQNFSLFEESWLTAKDEIRLESETDRLKHWRCRLFKAKGNPRFRDKWHAIPLSAERSLSTVYPVLFGAEGEDLDYRRIGRLYNAVYEALKSPKDENFQNKLNAACEKSLRLIEKFKYENYLGSSKCFFEKIRQDKKYYGATFYYFEKAHRTYAITSEVNSLLDAEDEDEIIRILMNSVGLKDIHFTALYNAFGFIDDCDDLIQCVLAFKFLVVQTVNASRLILDELIDKGYFGGKNEWYDLFLDSLNKMAEKVFYDPNSIDYSIKPGAQKCFETILFTPVFMHYEDGNERVDDW